MKILYGVQGTGNGHFSRAIAITPVLSKFGKVDILVSGSQYDIKLPFDVKYRRPGIGFHFGSQGGVDVIRTVRSQHPVRFLKDVNALPVQDYDLVISDFEPITAWACQLKRKACIGLSHQAAFLSQKTPRISKRSMPAEAILKHYAPTSDWIGFHYQSYDENIEEPIIRRSMRHLEPKTGEHYVVYLPAYSETYLQSYFLNLPQAEWRIYVKGLTNAYTFRNIQLKPVGSPTWLSDISSCQGIIIGAGFEGPSEMMFLGKNMIAIPMIGQYEQQCNAKALSELGVTVISHLSGSNKSVIENWMLNNEAICLNFPYHTDRIVENVLSKAGVSTFKPSELLLQ
ncbi:MAG: glycosyltransferase family protein [Saprospiraceae bacterium]|nr:glycosyltransferase family protein [Saprospiraceae bacterium]